MKFHLVVMQYNGEITDRQPLMTEHVRSDPITRRIVTGFTMMMEENLPKILDGTIHEQLRIFDDKRGLLDWRQPEPFSAMATFFIADQMKFTWTFFSGLDSLHDQIVVQAAEQGIDSFAIMADPKHKKVSLKGLADRPLALCVPWPPSPSAMEQRIAGNYAMCLAAAFFEKVADVQRRGAALIAEFLRRDRMRNFRWSDN
jgi:hypothetical protein